MKQITSISDSGAPHAATFGFVMSDQPAYPRPQFARAEWRSLNGRWAFAFAPDRDPEAVEWTREILVPFAPEAPRSGIGDPGFHPVVWYRRSFSVPESWRGQRVLLHFGAVDYRAEVWVNGQRVAAHEGGHTPFFADITEALVQSEQTVTVRAEDDPHDLRKPRGKQDWLEAPHAIWYPRTTGIWQSVWLEPVPETHLKSVRYIPDLTSFSIKLEVEVAGPRPDGLALDLSLRRGDEALAHDTVTVTGPTLARTLHLPDPGIDDARNAYLWSPERPTLFEVTLRLRTEETVLDQIESYTALRTVAAREGRFFLNGRPYVLRLALDQGYWEDGLLTAPDDDALRRDVELAKAMGFSGVRKHQKLEDPRYLYWADKLGLLVWEELPSAYAFGETTVARLAREWLEALARDVNHPCIVAWVPLNESWGVPDLPEAASQRALLRALYHLTKAFDSTRPVIGNDGWEQLETDLLTLHDYSRDPERLQSRYASRESVVQMLSTFRPGGRRLALDGLTVTDQPAILSEFGGVRYSESAGGWGYDEATSPEELLKKYRALVAAASQAGLAGFCYTQFADTFQERNGLLYMDRRPKLPLAEVFAATRNGG